MTDGTVLGADPTQLTELAGALDAAAHRLTSVAARLDPLVRGTRWRGPAATAFRHRWATDHRVLLTRAAACRRAAGLVRRAAEEQRAASRAVPGGARSPLRESAVTVRATARLGPFRVTPTWSARLTELERRRTRLVVSDALGVGLGAGAGSLVEVGCRDVAATPVPSMSRRAEVAAGLTVEHREVLEVPDADVHRTLQALALQRAAALVGLGPFAAHLAPRPRARGHEVLVHGEVTGAATVATGGAFGPGASAASRADLAVGRGTDERGRPVRVLELTSASAGAVHLGLLQRLGAHGPAVAGRTWVRVEAPDQSHGPATVRVELRSTGADGRTVRTVALVRPAAGRRALVALTHLDLARRAGRAPSADRVAGVLSGLTAGAVEEVRTEVLAAQVDGCHADAVQGAGATVGLGASVEVVNLGPP